VGRDRQRKNREIIYSSSQFQQIVSQALSADYVGAYWVDKQSLRFATTIVDRNEAFATTLEKYGHSYRFELDILPLSTVSTPPNGNLEEQSPESRKIRVRLTENIGDLAYMTHQNREIQHQTRKDILDWLRKEYKNLRGFGLGTFNSSLLARVMNSQSSKWEPIALGYIQDVITMAHQFILELFSLIFLEQRVRDELISVLLPDLTTRYDSALERTKFLLQIEREHIPMTLNHYFNNNLEKQ
jgi:hypothetical protein